MPTTMIDPALREEVQRILRASGWALREGQPLQIEGVNNSFQDKGNVYKIALPGGPSLILKLEHPFFRGMGIDHPE